MFRGVGLSDLKRTRHRIVTIHLALDLVDEKRAEAILNYCEEHSQNESGLKNEEFV